MSADWITWSGMLCIFWTCAVAAVPDRPTIAIWFVLAFFPLLREVGWIGPDPHFAMTTHLPYGEPK